MIYSIVINSNPFNKNRYLILSVYYISNIDFYDDGRYWNQ